MNLNPFANNLINSVNSSLVRNVDTLSRVLQHFTKFAKILFARILCNNMIGRPKHHEKNSSQKL